MSRLNAELSALALLSCLSVVGCGGGEELRRSQQAQYHADLAYGYLMEGQETNAALQEVLKSLKLREDDPATHHLAALIFMGRSDWLKALKHGKRALELKPDFYEAKNNLGVVYLSLGEWREAVTVFQELTGVLEYRTPARGYNNLGWALYKLGRLDEAKRALLSAVKLNPRLCPPHNNLGLVSLELGELALAQRELTRSVSLCPSYAEPHLHLARLHLERGARADAIGALERCVELGGDSELGLRCSAALQQSSAQLPSQRRPVERP